MSCIRTTRACSIASSIRTIIVPSGMPALRSVRICERVVINRRGFIVVALWVVALLCLAGCGDDFATYADQQIGEASSLG